jgi:NAD(P)-dependent dehydrogenase (short-subunit alcohol dehydrogenase family)
MTERRVVAIAGAARGIGLAAARRLAAGGAIVAGIDRDGERVEQAMRDVASGGGEALALAADVTERGEVERAFLEIDRRFGRLDVLVNCAGITGRTGIKAHEVDPDDFERVCRINLHAAMLLTRAALPPMLARGNGRILHVASIAGKEGNAGMLAYSASKAGLIGLVKSAAKDYAETGITINALAPAVIRTDIVAAMPEEQVRYMTDRIPMKRTGNLEEAAAMIEFIVSPDCAFTTGFTFDLSGGRATY